MKKNPRKVAIIGLAASVLFGTGPCICICDRDKR
jgi:hypothetical protein